MKIRRTPYVCFYAEDHPVPDVADLSRDCRQEPSAETNIVALVALSGERQDLSRAELEFMLTVRADQWSDADPGDRAVIQNLVEKGLLICDSDGGDFAALRERDGALKEHGWNLYAALYHYLTQWAGVEIQEGEAEAAELKARSVAAARAHIGRYGPPPGPFGKRHGEHEVRLPGRDRDGALYRALLARRTTRSFNGNSSMTLDELDSVLRYVFGCHGYARNAADVVCIKRTSPSGGGLHPIEIYPIIAGVAGIAPGIYHYDSENHSLTLLEGLERGETQRLATYFMCGQKYFGMAHVTFIMTARFSRNHWKYRHHPKAYAGILMDAAHLSQTLYLVSTDLDLGAFVTLAINGRDIENRLGIDGVGEGVVAMAGCGRRAPGKSPLELDFSEALDVN